MSYTIEEMKEAIEKFKETNKIDEENPYIKSLIKRKKKTMYFRATEEEFKTFYEIKKSLQELLGDNFFIQNSVIIRAALYEASKMKTEDLLRSCLLQMKM